MDAHYSFVVDQRGHAGYQAYLLARSLIELGGVSPARISACLVSGTQPAAERALADLGISTDWVEPHRDPYCNKLQQLQGLKSIGADYFVLLDTDMFSVLPLEYTGERVVAGKMVDVANPPFEVASAIFKVAGLPGEPAGADVAGTTIRANFNGGLYIVPGECLTALAGAWRRWADWSLDHRHLYLEWSDHVDQLSFAMAVAELGLPTTNLGREYNTPTHLGPIELLQAPRLLHYHRSVDSQFLLKPTGSPPIDAAIQRANQAIKDWRRTDLQNALFWSARYALFSDIGSGVGSRGEFLDHKREVLEKVIAIVKPDSIVDIGGGDGEAIVGLAKGIEHHAIDIAEEASRPYLERNPDAVFAIGDISVAPAVRAELALCIDLLIHLADRGQYRSAVRNAIHSGTRAALITGFDENPSQPATTTYFHEPLLETIEADPETVAYPVMAYRELTGYLVQRGMGTGHARDAQPRTIRRAIPLTPDPIALLECVTLARRELGFFPDHLPRAIEYPWLLKAVRDLGRAGLSIVDIGAGVNPLPLLLADDGHRVTTIDPHRVQRTQADRADWNEWGFLDYAELRPSIVSRQVSYEESHLSELADVVYSISVIEHLPAVVRRQWLARISQDLRHDGRVFLTVDLEPMSTRLWRRSEGLDVESATDHGDLGVLRDEMGSAGLTIDGVTVHEWLPLSRVGVAMISARLSTPPK